ncbi:unnamed protein product, partial [Mesorhabditis spiculigera]
MKSNEKQDPFRWREFMPALQEIDYNADADRLLAASRMADKDGYGPCRKRAFVDLPLELLAMIVDPLDYLTVMNLDNLNPRLKAACAKYPVNYARCAPVIAEKRHKFIAGQREQNIQTKDAALLDGRRLEFFVRHRDWRKRIKCELDFWCENFVDYNWKCSPLLDDTLIWDITLRNPTNVWTARYLNVERWLGPLRGSLRIGAVAKAEDFAHMKLLRTARLAFYTPNPDDNFVDLLIHYVEEWLAGERDIETIWAHWRVGGLGDVGEEAPKRDHLKGLVEKYEMLAESEGKSRVQFVRTDGELVELRVRETDLVIQVPGSTTKFIGYQKRPSAGERPFPRELRLHCHEEAPYF